MTEHQNRLLLITGAKARPSGQGHATYVLYNRSPETPLPDFSRWRTWFLTAAELRSDSPRGHKSGARTEPVHDITGWPTELLVPWGLNTPVGSDEGQ